MLYITTFTRKKFHYGYKPVPEWICIEDIAHSLAHLCRFGGHSSKFYSVAEHCVRVANRVQRSVASGYETGLVFAALLHDASEAYYVDIPRPLKQVLPGYRDMEAVCQRVIEQTFHLPPYMTDHPTIDTVDARMCVTEAVALFPNLDLDEWFGDKVGHREPYDDEYFTSPWDPRRAELNFLREFASAQKLYQEALDAGCT